MSGAKLEYSTQLNTSLQQSLRGFSAIIQSIERRKVLNTAGQQSFIRALLEELTDAAKISPISMQHTGAVNTQQLPDVVPAELQQYQSIVDESVQIMRAKYEDVTSQVEDTLTSIVHLEDKVRSLSETTLDKEKKKFALFVLRCIESQPNYLPDSPEAFDIVVKVLLDTISQDVESESWMGQYLASTKSRMILSEKTRFDTDIENFKEYLSVIKLCANEAGNILEGNNRVLESKELQVALIKLYDDSDFRPSRLQKLGVCFFYAILIGICLAITISIVAAALAHPVSLGAMILCVLCLFTAGSSVQALGLCIYNFLIATPLLDAAKNLAGYEKLIMHAGLKPEERLESEQEPEPEQEPEQEPELEQEPEPEPEQEPEPEPELNPESATQTHSITRGSFHLFTQSSLQSDVDVNDDTASLVPNDGDGIEMVTLGKK